MSDRSIVTGNEPGQGLAEYALILALIALAAVLAVTFLGGAIDGMLSQAASLI
ncbi:MAG TPA: hypothetical protein VM305_08845 [Candidatus Limnocylindrales bacterium]|nr:hypothetical protein [Candidatus Limnocylindrales bacterium]